MLLLYSHKLRWSVTSLGRSRVSYSAACSLYRHEMSNACFCSLHCRSITPHKREYKLLFSLLRQAQASRRFLSHSQSFSSVSSLQLCNGVHTTVPSASHTHCHRRLWRQGATLNARLVLFTEVCQAVEAANGSNDGSAKIPRELRILATKEETIREDGKGRYRSHGKVRVVQKGETRCGLFVGLHSQADGSSSVLKVRDSRSSSALKDSSRVAALSKPWGTARTDHATSNSMHLYYIVCFAAPVAGCEAGMHCHAPQVRFSAVTGPVSPSAHQVWCQSMVRPTEADIPTTASVAPTHPASS